MKHCKVCNLEKPIAGGYAKMVRRGKGFQRYWRCADCVRKSAEASGK